MSFAEWGILGFFVGGTLFFLTAIPFYIYYGRLWMRAQTMGVPVRIAEMLAMTFRKSPPHLVVRAYLDANRAGEPVPLHRVEEMHRGGVRVREVADAVILAKRTSYPLGFEEACSLALRGVNLREHIQTSGGQHQPSHV